MSVVVERIVSSSEIDVVHLSVLLAGRLLLVLVGCSGGDSGSVSTTTNAAAEDEEDEETDEEETSEGGSDGDLGCCRETGGRSDEGSS